MADLERFNPYHGKAGSGHGGQFTSSGGAGGGSKPAGKPAHPGTPGKPPQAGSGHAGSGGGHAERVHALREKIRADEAQISALERQVHAERQALHAASAQAAHHKAQAAAAKKAKNAPQHQKHTAAHHKHQARSTSHRQKIAGLEHRIGELRAKVKTMRAEVAKLTPVSRAGPSGVPGVFPSQLAHWWEHGAGAAKIRWGTPGDFDRCVRLAVEEAHMTPERAKGFCNLRHHAVLHIYPATHAAMENKAVGRSTVTEPAQYDADGLDQSWDGDLSDLPDLTGLTVADLEALDPAGPGVSRAMPKLGSGARFAALKAKLAARGVKDPGALAAHIGRRKYGKAKFGKLASKARAARSVSRAEDARGATLTRPWVVEDLRIMRAADGEPGGRVVEGYAAVFGQPQPITDHQGEGYSEEIDPHAFDHALARMASRKGGVGAAVRVLFNHGKTIEGHPAPEFQKPIGRAVSVTPDARGLLTRTELNRTPLADEVLELISSGSITGMSFQGRDLRSDPPLRGPGDRYRKGQAVRRMALSLFEYSPVVFEAYPGAEFLGVVRMGAPEGYEDVTATDGGSTAEVEEAAATEDGGATGSTPEEVRPTRDHAHRLLVTRMQDMCQRAGIVLPGRG